MDLDWTLIWTAVLTALGLGGFRSYKVLSAPPKKARIIYLGKSRENYVRLRSNPGFTIGNLHYCRKGKSCPWRKGKK